MLDYTQLDIMPLVRDIIELIGDNPEREGLKDTPKRVAQMYAEIFSGYYEKCPNLKTFKSDNNEMIVKSDITTFSVCEHHILPMKLKVAFAYIPDGKVVGISKIIRLIKWCSARLTIQENLTVMIVDEFMKQVQPKGCMCVIKGHHYCEEMRGVKTENLTQTSAIRGVFEKPEVRSEALSLIKNGEE